MFGMYLMICIGITVLCITWLIISIYNKWEGGMIVSTILTIIFILVVIFTIANIPDGKLESKRQVEYIKVFSETLEYNRDSLTSTNQFERIKVLEEINEINGYITSWKTKGDYWYQNKWLYHNDTKNVDYIK